MEVILSHIKSFNEDPLYSKHSVVPNYSLCKEDEKELALKKKMLVLRKVSKILAFRQKVRFDFDSYKEMNARKPSRMKRR